ncbi:O-antigen ligase [Arenibacter sp. ARW7G5Y1]|nr:O-antigen ligase [Arenibacter sp. ARW7G5Y1]
MTLKIDCTKIRILRLEHSINLLIVLLLFSLYVFLPSIDFLPFRRSPVTGKFIIFLLATLLIVCLFLGKLKVSDESFSIGRIDISILLLVVYITFNRYFFQPTYGFSIRFYELLGLLALYFVIKSLTPKHHSWLLIAAIIGANIQIIIGWLQLYGLIESNSSVLKVTGGFFNSGPYSGYLVAVFPIGLQFLKNGNFLIEDGKKYINIRKAIVHFAVVLNIIGCVTIIPALRSRAAFIVIFFTVGYIYRKNIQSFFEKNTKKRVVKVLLVLGAICCMITSIIFIYNFKKGSTEGRLLILKTTVEMLKDRPVMGFGYDRFHSNYMLYQSEYFEKHNNIKMALRAGNTAYAFNEPLQFSVENGILGLSILLLVLYFLIIRRGTLKENEPLYEMAMAGILSIIIFSLFSYPSKILPIKLVLILYVAILSANQASSFCNRFKPQNKSKSRSFYILLISLSISCLLFYKTLKLAKAYYVWNNSHENYLDKDFNLAVKGYRLIYPFFDTDGKFLTDYGLALYSAKDTYAAINILSNAKNYSNNSVIENVLGNCYKEIEDYKNAEICYQRSINMVPGSFRSHYLLLKMYSDNNQMENAVNVANRILNLKVTVPSETTFEIINGAKNFLKLQGVNYVD